MEFAGREEIRFLIDDHDHLHQQDSVCSPAAAAAVTVCLCRICHEEEEERSTAMESPCACSGTLKFAHRECIQRWCYEKGSVVCEICLQNFEPGYTVNQKKALVDVEVTIRGSLEVPRINYDPRNPEFVYVNDDGDSDYAECSPASSFRVSYFRSVALIFIVVLLVRNLVGVMTAGEDHYAFTILTVFLLRASGILLPLYLVMRFIAALQEAEQEDNLQQQQLQIEEIFSTQRGNLEEHYDEHRIQISL
ncbi:uncharacterized protein LOC122033675 [Zingiber officinale]|uniref:uncharacterized protein LOC122033675 n=1 Tax=Zingiber officinale TaxID=94328 RepID=UPI001C4BCF96|nr:uncharacterized protein LOC122033675 [Zingiber officinale]